MNVANGAEWLKSEQRTPLFAHKPHSEPQLGPPEPQIIAAKRAEAAPEGEEEGAAFVCLFVTLLPVRLALCYFVASLGPSMRQTAAPWG